MVKKELIIGPIPDNFNPEHHIPYSVQCFLHKEHVYPEWDNLPLLNQSIHRKNLELFSETYLNTVLVNEFTSYLNTLHGTTYSTSFWSILIKPWLVFFFHTSIDIFIQLITSIDQYKSDSLSVNGLILDNKWDFVDSADFFKKGMINPCFYHWLASQFISHIAPDHWSISYTHFQPQPSSFTQSHTDYRFRRVLGLSKFSAFQEIILSFFLSKKCFSSPKRQKQYKNIPLENCFDDPHQANLFRDIFLNTIFSIAKLTLPLSLTSHFNQFNHRAKRKKYKKNRLRIYNISKIMNFIQTKFYLAHAKEQGELITSVQHGGNYGLEKFHAQVNELEFGFDYFLSWGWTQQDDYDVNAIPFPSPFLKSFQDKHHEKTPYVILVGNVMWPFGFSKFNGSTPDNLINYRKQKLVFLSNLNDSTFSNVLYRYYPKTSGSLQDKEYVLKTFPNLSLCEGHFHPQLMTCRCVVLDHIGTTLNIALTANVPTLLYLDPDTAFARQEKPYMDRFEKLNMLFYSPTKASDFLNANYQNISEWWFQKEIQDFRKEWLNRQCLTSNHCFYDWIKKLYHLK